MNYENEGLSHRIIGCAMRVHNALGNGFQEVIYQRALAMEMMEVGINFSRECEMPIFYKNREIGIRRVDFFIEDHFLLELKAVIQLEPVHLAQAKNYLEAFNKHSGLLINFGGESLEFRRLFRKNRKQAG